MSIYEMNLAFFKVNANKIYEKLVASNSACEKPRYSVLLDSNKDAFKVKVDNKELYLSSVINQKGEAEKLLVQCDDRANLVILLGIGNISIFSQIKKHFLNMNRLIIIEPSLEIFKEVLKRKHIKEIFAAYPATDISLIINEDVKSVDNLYRSFIHEQKGGEYVTAAICSIPYSQLFPYYRKKIFEFVDFVRSQLTLNYNTFYYFRYLWLFNNWKNLRDDAPDATLLMKLFKQENLPAIIVSAGPSLQKNIHLLKNVGDRAVIMAGGSSAKILDSHGIIPHFRMDLDGSPLQTRIFGETNPEECPLLYTDTAFYENIIDLYKGNTIHFFTNASSRVKSYLYKKMEKEFIEFPMGNSISNAAVFIASFLGCKKIILMGQDLSYKENKNYTPGSWASEKENLSIGEYHDKLHIKNIVGEDVYTSAAYLSMRNAFQSVADNYHDCIFINATEGGINIAGYENRTFAHVLQHELPETASFDIRKYIRDCLEQNRSLSKENFEQMSNAVITMKNEILALKRENDLLLRYLKNSFDKKSEGKIRKQYNLIRRNVIFLEPFSNLFRKEETEINLLSTSKDNVKKHKVFMNFAQALDEYIKFSCELADEFLSNEEKMTVFFQV